MSKEEYLAIQKSKQEEKRRIATEAYWAGLRKNLDALNERFLTGRTKS